MIRFAFLIAVGYCLGMFSTMHYYNPDTLENNAVQLVEISYASGSVYGMQLRGTLVSQPEYREHPCRQGAKHEKAAFEAIVRHTIWKKY